jgi:hypothetical protein
MSGTLRPDRGVEKSPARPMLAAHFAGIGRVLKTIMDTSTGCRILADDATVAASRAAVPGQPTVTVTFS